MSREQNVAVRLGVVNSAVLTSTIESLRKSSVNVAPFAGFFAQGGYVRKKERAFDKS